MALAGANWAPSTLPAEVLAELAQSLEPIRRDAHIIYRRNVREAMLSVESPGYGKFSALAVRLIGECALLRNVDTPFPQAVRVLRGKVPGYFLLEPLMRYDEADPEQYRLRWYEGNRVAKIDLLPALQPHNLDVEKGYVMEVAVSLERLPEAGYFLVLHVGDGTIRPRKSRKKGGSGNGGGAAREQVEKAGPAARPASEGAGPGARSGQGQERPGAPEAADRSGPTEPVERRVNHSAAGGVNEAPEVERDGGPGGADSDKRGDPLDGP